MNENHVRCVLRIAHERMMDEKTEELFCDLMELSPGARMDALEALPDLSPAQKETIRRLLEQAGQAEAYFTGTSPAVKMVPISAQVEHEGEQCGPYKLIRKLGEGGFGVVWLAQQEKPLRRTVAVKVIKAGMDTIEVLARFDAEKQALARMNHPNIAQVLDAGMTERGRPFFVMELVEGTSITRYCRERGIGIQERLRLFGDVCAALGHAHQKGVIHRDIKPSNVIVTETGSEPVVKVIDFGIAKAIEGHLTDHTLKTRQEQWIGTPTYMSPEQAGLVGGDVDTRSDIYALGVLLYELITGEAPFDSASLLKAGYEEMRRIIREVEPPRPSERIATTSREGKTPIGSATVSDIRTAREISSELDWIVMKAMDKARERRYESAAALAGDIGRYLADEPVLARPPSTLYQLAKFARRHRLGILIAGAFLVLILAAAMISFWLAIRAREAERIARERLATALEERNSKNQALEEAEAVSRLLADVFQRPQPGIDGRSVTVLQALDKVAEKLDGQLSGQPQRKALLFGVLAETYDRLGVPRRSFELRKRNYESIKNTSGAGHPSTRQALRKLVEAAESTGDSKIALQYAQLELETLRNAAAPPREIETAMQSAVRGWFGIGERDKAIELQRELVDSCIRNHGVNSPQHIESTWELRQYEARSQVPGKADAESHPSTLQASGDTPGKPEDIPDLEEKFSGLVALHGSLHEETIKARTALARALFRAGHTIESLIHVQALQSATMELFGPLDDRTLRVQSMLVDLYVTFSRLEDAVRVQQVVVNVLRERDGGAAETTVEAENRLERRLFYTNHWEEYYQYCRDLLQRRTRLFGKEHINTVMLWSFGEVTADEAEEKIRTAIRVTQEHFGPKSRSTAEAISALARKKAGEGKVQEALPFYAECAPNMLDDTWLNFECAVFQEWTGDREGYRTTRSNILRYWERRIERQVQSPDQFDRAMWLSCLAEPDDETQKHTLSNILEWCRKIRMGLLMEAKDRHSVTIQNQIHGIVLYRLGRYEDAIGRLQEAMRVIDAGNPNPGGMDYQLAPQMVCFFIAMAKHRQGNREEALQWFQRGESLLEGPPPSAENPVLPYIIGGNLLATWVSHREAKQLLSKETP
jgi:serine/threonine protein kinase